MISAVVLHAFASAEFGQQWVALAAFVGVTSSRPLNAPMMLGLSESESAASGLSFEQGPN